MTDVVDRATRSRLMSGIRGIDTTPEKQTRSMLHRNGFRFSLHRKDLPGKPDIVLPKYGAVIFVNGCFWHRHQCHMFKWPKSNKDFWHAKINSNARRDQENIASLFDQNWRIMVVWECALRGARANPQKVCSSAIRWLRGRQALKVIAG